VIDAPATAEDRHASEARSVLAAEREALIDAVRRRRERAAELHGVLEVLEHQLVLDEQHLAEISGLLGLSSQLRIDELDERLRGRRLKEVAVEVLSREVGADRPVHYREWFELVRAAGYEIAGKDPLATFLAQITRADGVEGLGHRSGRYKLSAAA